MVSITFASPERLWFLLALPIVFVAHFYLLRHAHRRALQFANFAVLKRATGERVVTRNYTLLVLRLGIVLAAVLAAAQMSFWYESVTNENEYVLTIDTSSSMSAQDIPPTRLDAARQYALGFISTLDAKTRVGIVSFSGVTFIEQTLTEDRQKLVERMQELSISASGTDIPGAIITSTNLLMNTEKGRAVILLTDGSSTIETFQSRSLQRALAYARENRVQVYAIGIGSDVSSPVGYLPEFYNVSAVYNEENLIGMANMTGGQYFRAADAQQLQDAYAAIRSSDRPSIVAKDLTGTLMLTALVLILIEWGLASTRFKMLP